MTNWQKVSNFFLDIRLERPEAVVIDRASRELRDLYNLSDHGSASSFHLIAEDKNLPEYHDRGVLIYDENEEEPAFYQDFQEKKISDVEREEIKKLIPEKMETNEFSLNVDVYNEFDVKVPSNDYIDNTDFSKFEEILEDNYRPGV